MKLKNIVDQIVIWDGWLSSYNKFVPQFIEEAKTKVDWKDWDKDIFYEFFERSADQCVSSLKQGYFTDVEKAKIKENWSLISVVLKQIAEKQETPQWDIYNELKRVIRQYTSQDRRASTNRLIASLQPKLLCTIVNEDKLYELFIYLKKNNIEGAPDYKGGNWYKNSHAMLQFYKEQLPEKDYMEIITYPWQTREYLIELSKKNPNMSIENDAYVDLLLQKKQIIFQGAPGTGKTFTAKDIAEKLIYNEISAEKKEQAEKLDKTDQYKLIQFHPAYTYEDFVRGIVIDTTNGLPEYKTINKILGLFATEANKNWIDSKKTPVTLSKERAFNVQLEEFKKIVEEKIAVDSSYKIEGTTAIITEVADEAFRFTYEHDTRVNYTLLYSDLQKLNNSDIEFNQVKDVDEFELFMKRKASYYFRLFKSIKATKIGQNIPTDIQVKEKNYVLVIDEINRANLPAVLGELINALEYRGEKVNSLHAIDGDDSLVLPPNLYIIGTMNTADRSVGLIDYAIRRRFAFVDVLPKVLSENEAVGFHIDLFKEVSSLFIQNIDEYIANENCKLIPAEYLSDEFRPEDVWIGHSYFIMLDREGKDITNIRLKYEIIPILKEYTKDGIFKKSIEGKIDNLISYL